jgi:hypothetical protein
MTAKLDQPQSSSMHELQLDPQQFSALFTPSFRSLVYTSFSLLPNSSHHFIQSHQSKSQSFCVFLLTVCATSLSLSLSLSVASRVYLSLFSGAVETETWLGPSVETPPASHLFLETMSISHDLCTKTWMIHSAKQMDCCASLLPKTRGICLCCCRRKESLAFRVLDGV